MVETCIRLTRPVLLAALVAVVSTQLVSCAGSQSNSTVSEVPSSAAPAPSPPVSTDETNAGAEAFYQQLLSQHGEDCTECLQPIRVQLRDNGFSGGSAIL